MRLLADHPGGRGYLLKDRISDVAVLTDALHRLTEGESVVDPTIVSRLAPPAARTQTRSTTSPSVSAMCSA